MDVLQILNKINDRLSGTRGDFARVKALVIEVDGKNLSKAAIRSRTRKLVAAYRELQAKNGSGDEASGSSPLRPVQLASIPPLPQEESSHSPFRPLSPFRPRWLASTSPRQQDESSHRPLDSASSIPLPPSTSPYQQDNGSQESSVGSPLRSLNAPYTSPLQQDHDSREPSGGGRSRLLHLLSLHLRPPSPSPLFGGQLYLHLDRGVQPDSHDVPASPSRQHSHASCTEEQPFSYLDSGVESTCMSQGSRPVSTVETPRLLQAPISTETAPSSSNDQHNSSQTSTSLRSRHDPSSDNQDNVFALDRMRSLQSSASTEPRFSASSIEKQGKTPHLAGHAELRSSSSSGGNQGNPTLSAHYNLPLQQKYALLCHSQRKKA